MVNYLDLRPLRSFENPFSDWRQLGAKVLLLHAVAFSTANAQSKPTDSPIPAQAKTQSTKAAIGNQSQNAPLFSFTYTIDAAKPTAFGGDAEPVQNSSNLVLLGLLSDEGKIINRKIPWFATVDSQGKVRWAGRLGVERPKVRAEITNRGDRVFGYCQTGENELLVTDFSAQSMTATKAVQLNLDPVLNSAFTELPGTAPLPPVVPVIQDGGDSFALTVVSQDAEISLNKIYSIPAFATRTKNPKEDGFMITITTNDVAVPRDPADWSNALPNSIPVKQVAIYNSDKHPELKKAAAEGKTVTLRGSLANWERHLKLGRHDVLMFTLN